LNCIHQRCTPLVAQTRYYRRPAAKKGLVSKFIDNIKEGIERDKQLQENLKKFKEETKKVEESDVAKEVKERLSMAGRLKSKMSPLTDQVEKTIQETSKTVSSTYEKIVKEAADSEVLKKTTQIKDEVGKTAQDVTSKISEQGEQLGKTEIGKQATAAFTAVKSDLFDDLAKESRPYQRPEKLKRRTPQGPEKKPKEYKANEDATNVVMHKDSIWQQQWRDFRENNPVVTGIFTLKMKYDESDNAVVRATRVVTEKLSDIFSDVFSQSEMAATMAEITKIDPTFNKDAFLKECEFEIIPTVLEAYLRADVDVLRDWCHDGAFNVLSAQLKNNQALGMTVKSRVLDIRDVELAVAKIMDQGPVFILTFQVQQTILVTDTRGKVIEGGEDQIENINYVWAICRDQTIFDHKSAWKILEFAIQQATPYL